MRSCRRWVSYSTILFLCAAGVARAADEPDPAPAGAALFDTTTSSAVPLAADALMKRAGWSQIAEDRTPDSFKGDAVLAGGKIILVLRKGAACAELYAMGAKGPLLRARLVPIGSAAGLKVASVKAVENTVEAASVEVTFRAGGKNGSVVFKLDAINAVVRTQARDGVAGMRLEAPARLGILPDFFADDMMIDARTVPLDETEVPSENFFMQMVGGGEAIVTTVWDRSPDDVRLTLTGKGDERVITGVNVRYGAKDKAGKPASIWVAVLAGKGIWSHVDVTDKNAGKTLTFKWQVPFPAKWKVNLMRANQTADSWDLLFNPRTRSQWATAIGRYTYPVWATTDRKTKVTRAHVESPKSNRGPVIVYPIGRGKRTPLDKYTVTDVMRRSLGVGPCAYIMDVEGQGVKSKGLYTCAAYDLLVPIFKAGRQKDERDTIARTLKETVIFVHAIRQRIMDYVKFGDEMLVWLGEQKKVHPDQAAYIGEMTKLTRVIRAQYKRRKRCTEVDVVKLSGQLCASLTQDAPKIDGSRVLRTIRDGVGGPQDDLVGACRIAVKVLRQRAAVGMVLDPKRAPIALEIRTRTRAILRNKYGHEGR
mgnify:CR=1 FL=1